jgi:hypothetical protein
VGADELHEHTAEFEGDMHYQPVFVPAKIEDDTDVPHEGAV